MTEPSDHLTRLREQHAEVLRAIRESGFDLNRPRLPERNWFFCWLRNGDDDRLDRIRPQWLAFKRNKKLVRQLRTRIKAAVRQKVVDESGYRALDVQAGAEKRAKRSCKRLIASIRQAQQRLRTAADRPGTASRADVKRDVKDVTKRLQAVRQRVDDLAGQHSFRPGELPNLDGASSRSEGHEDRRKQYAEITRSLGSLDKTAKNLLREISAREKEVRAKQHKYLKDGRSRYGRPSDGRG